MKSVTRAALLGALMHAFSGVGDELVRHVTRPARQAVCMEGLLEVLAERIKRFKPTNKGN